MGNQILWKEMTRTKIYNIYSRVPYIPELVTERASAMLQSPHGSELGSFTVSSAPRPPSCRLPGSTHTPVATPALRLGPTLQNTCAETRYYKYLGCTDITWSPGRTSPDIGNGSMSALVEMY